MITLAPKMFKNVFPVSNAKTKIAKHCIVQQTCGWPLISDQRVDWSVIGVPIYAAEGCQNHFYSSVIVVGVSHILCQQYLIVLHHV